MDYSGTKSLGVLIQVVAAAFALCGVISGLMHLLDAVALNRWEGMVPSVAAFVTALFLIGLGRGLVLVARIAETVPAPAKQQTMEAPANSSTAHA